MTDFLQDMINCHPNILNDSNITFNTALIKNATTEQILKLSIENKMLLVNDLLGMIQPYLSANNLSVEPIDMDSKPKTGLKLPPI